MKRMNGDPIVTFVTGLNVGSISNLTSNPQSDAASSLILTSRACLGFSSINLVYNQNKFHKCRLESRLTSKKQNLTLCAEVSPSFSEEETSLSAFDTSDSSSPRSRLSSSSWGADSAVDAEWGSNASGNGAWDVASNIKRDEDNSRLLRRKATAKNLKTNDILLEKRENGGRLSSYCVAQEYKMLSLARFLSRRRNLFVEAFDDVLHAVEKNSEADVFVFPYGVVVVWDMQDAMQEQAVISTLRPFEKNPLSAAEYDGFEYEFGDNCAMKRDVVTLLHRGARQAESSSDGTADMKELRREQILERLAVSHAIAQSVRLTCFEDSVQKTIAATRHFPEEMARDGMISKSRSEVSKYMGRLILDRHSVFLYADILDTPEFFWENERFEPQYRVTERYLELRPRAEVLNRRVEVVRDLFELLSQELQFKHSSDLEVIVIVLIAFEILLTLVKDGLEVLSVRKAGGRIDMMSAIGLLFVVSVVSLAVASLLLFFWRRIKNRRRTSRKP